MEGGGDSLDLYLTTGDQHDDFEQRVRVGFEHIHDLVQATVLPGLRLGASGARASVRTAAGVRHRGSGAFDPVLWSVNAATVELETKIKPITKPTH